MTEYRQMSLSEARDFDMSFPIQVPYVGAHGWDDAVAWCTEKFGSPAWGGPLTNINDVCVYVAARWSYTRDGRGDHFVFSDETDAMHFKLRWVG